MISRTTFYLHYQDKYDLLDKIGKEIKHFFRLIMSENGDSSFYYKLNKTTKEVVSHNIGHISSKIPLHYAIAFFKTCINKRNSRIYIYVKS